VNTCPATGTDRCMPGSFSRRLFAESLVDSC
jgi:hypothetical protein